MVQVNKTNGVTTITMENTGIEDVFEMQRAIIDLIRNYDFENFGSHAARTIANATYILESLLPDLNQLKKGFAIENNLLEVPETLNTPQVQAIKDALFQIKTGDKVKPGNNPVFEALYSLKV